MELNWLWPLRDQVKTFGGEFRYGDIVTRIERMEGGRFRINTEMGSTYIYEAVILTFGKIPIRMV